MGIYRFNMRSLMSGSGSEKTRKQQKLDQRKIDRGNMPTVNEIRNPLNKKRKKMADWKPSKASRINLFTLRKFSWV